MLPGRAGRFPGLGPFPHLGLIEALAAQHRTFLAVRGREIFIENPVAVLRGKRPAGRPGRRVNRLLAIYRVRAVHGSGNSSLALGKQ